jgi:four helix bundle protein
VGDRRVRGYRDLDAWRHAMELCRACYVLVGALPSEERFALGSQIRRAACSVPMNIAEGYGYGTRPVFLKHLRIARGSLAELGTALDIAVSLSLCPDNPTVREGIERTARIIHGLIRSLQTSASPGPDK